MNSLTNTHNLPIPFAAYKGSENFIFISYSHLDSSLVYPEITKFHRQGYRVWYDEGIEPGIEWPEEIGNALNSSSLFVVFITPNSVNSENVRNEINFALARKMPFIAIHLVPTTLTPGLQLQIGSKQAILRYQMDEDSFTRKYQYSFDSVLRPGQPPVAPPPVASAPVSELQPQPAQKVAEPSAPFEPKPTAGAIAFKCDLVRRAACAELGLPDEKALEQKHTLAVKRLRLFGNLFGEQLLARRKFADHLMVYKKAGLPELIYERGDVSDLSDFVHFRGLTDLLLPFQRFNDLSPLRDLSIEVLDISCNLLGDLSPLGQLVNLKHLELDFCTFENLLPLEHCRNLSYLAVSTISSKDFEQLCAVSFNNLYHLDISESKLESLAGISHLRSINFLEIRNCTIFEFTDLGKLKSLDTLSMNGTNCSDYSFLKQLPNLQTLTVNDDQKPAVIELFGGKAPEFLK